MDAEDIVDDAKRLLRAAVGDPATLPNSINEFLRLLESVPDETLASGSHPWPTLENLAYELRYYQPAARDETLIDDQHALQHIREALRQLS